MGFINSTSIVKKENMNSIFRFIDNGSFRSMNICLNYEVDKYIKTTNPYISNPISDDHLPSFKLQRLSLPYEFQVATTKDATSSWQGRPNI